MAMKIDHRAFERGHDRPDSERERQATIGRTVRQATIGHRKGPGGPQWLTAPAGHKKKATKAAEKRPS